MAGIELICHEFGERVESSVYVFEHHRYDAVELRIQEQQGSRLLVAAHLHGDVDDLGVPEWNVEQWLDFAGITVALSDVRKPKKAARRLAAFTDITGLVADEGLRFSPA